MYSCTYRLGGRLVVYESADRSLVDAHALSILMAGTTVVLKKGAAGK